MRRKRQRWLFAFSLTISVAVHASGLALIQRAIDRAEAAQVSAESQEQMALLLPSEVELGIDSSNDASNTWLGFSEPQPQLAPPDVVEQAAFTDEPISVAAASEASNSKTPERSEVAPATAAEANASPPSESSPDDPIATPANAAAEAIARLMNSLKRLAQQTLANSGSDAALRDSAAAIADAQSSNSTRSQTNDGLSSDKDSNASSIVDVPREQWQLGKPLAAHGLELKPQRPEFTILTLLTASPGNPICRIDFNRDGVPVNAALERSSGDRRVDDAILASLYRWRASGRPLHLLQGDQSISVTIHILLTRRVET
jgi:outer membrane biosynthesis protein TonB